MRRRIVRVDAAVADCAGAVRSHDGRIELSGPGGLARVRGPFPGRRIARRGRTRYPGTGPAYAVGRYQGALWGSRPGRGLGTVRASDRHVVLATDRCRSVTDSPARHGDGEREQRIENRWGAVFRARLLVALIRFRVGTTQLPLWRRSGHSARVRASAGS